jgi:hypothetical protein
MGSPEGLSALAEPAVFAQPDLFLDQVEKLQVAEGVGPTGPGAANAGKRGHMT